MYNNSKPTLGAAMSHVVATTPLAMPTVKQLLQSVINPDVIDFWLQQVRPTWSMQRGLATIVGREQINHDTLTVFLRPNRHVPTFQAGQHLNLTVQINGVRIARSYSPSRHPAHPQDIAITVKRIEGGVVSTWLHTQAKVGDVVELDGVFGQMTLPAADQPLLLLAAGSGITPMISLLRESYRISKTRPAPTTLLYWVRSPADISFLAELQQYAAQDHQFTFHIFFTRSRDEQGYAGEGRIDNTQLNQAVADRSRYIAYVCGGAGFVQTAQQLLQGQVQQLLTEAFSLPVLDDSLGTVQVTLTKQNRTLTIAKNQAILPALEAQGIRPAYGCRMGICNTCVCPKSQGTTTNVLDGSTQHDATQALKICVSSARSDLTLDL